MTTSLAYISAPKPHAPAHRPPTPLQTTFSSDDPPPSTSMINRTGEPPYRPQTPPPFPLPCARFPLPPPAHEKIIKYRKRPPSSGPEKGVIAKGVFSLEESPESLNSLNSLDSLDSLGNGRILLCFPHSGGSLESLEVSKFSR